MGHLEITYDWLVSVLQKQERWLPLADLWAAFPFKSKVSKTEFEAVIDQIKKIQNEKE
jgi:hypothetical protein